MSGTTQADPQYTGPHQSFRCTADTKIEDWYQHDETENKDVKADNKTVWDAKYKHSSGFVRYKLNATPNAQGLTLANDAQARFDWQGLSTTLEFKGKDFTKEVDFGTHHFRSVFMNPYCRWKSNLSFRNNNLALGWVARYQDFMLRQALVVNGLNERGVKDGEAVEQRFGDVVVEQKAKFVRDQLSFEWYNKMNFSGQKHELWKLLLSWSNKEYGVALNASGEGTAIPRLTSYLRYRACNNLSLGAHYSYQHPKDETQKPDHSGKFGVKYTGDKSTTLRATVDHDLNNQINAVHRLSDSCTMNFTLEQNIRSYFKSDYKSSGGFMGYPFKYGLVFKLDG